MSQKVNYSVGNCFLVPLRNGGFARGLISKMDGKGSVFGYFFGPKFKNESEVPVVGLNEVDAYILKGKFGDLGLIKEEWKLIGSIANWNSENYPLPKFLRLDNDGVTGYLSTYNNDTFDFEREVVVDISKISPKEYPIDRMMGYGSVEIKLTKLLSE